MEKEEIQLKAEALRKRKEMVAKYKKLYEEQLPAVTAKTPTKDHLKSHAFEQVAKASSVQVIKSGRYVLTQKFGFGSDFYPLTDSEIVSIMDYYSPECHDIEVQHYSLPQVQGFTDVKNVTLRITSPGMSKSIKSTSLRKTCLFVFLHEMSHMLGNISDTHQEQACELEADRFAAQELLKWEKIMNLED